MAVLTIDRNDISPSLSRLIATARNPVPVLRAMDATFKSIPKGTFHSVGAGKRSSPWPVATARAGMKCASAS